MLSKTSAPFANCVFGVAKLSSDLFAGQTLCAAQDNPTSVRKRTLRLVLTQLSLQKTALLITEYNRNRCPTPHAHPLI